jgi:hypothetical protein
MPVAAALRREDIDPLPLLDAHRRVGREQGGGQGAADSGFGIGKRPAKQFVEDMARRGQGLSITLEDRGHADVLRGIVEPAIVVGHQAHGGIGQLRLAGEEHLGHVGHADQMAAGLAQEVAFGLRPQAGAFDAGIGQSAAQRHAGARGGRLDGVDHRAADRLGRRHMGSHTTTEEGPFALPAGPVDILLGHRQRTGRHVQRQTADGREAQQHRGAGPLEREHVGTVVDFVRQKPMAGAMARQEQHRLAVQPALEDVTGGRAEGCAFSKAGLDVEPCKVVQTGSANDGQHGVTPRCGLPCVGL